MALLGRKGTAARLREELAESSAKLAAALIEIEALRAQLVFWHEQSRALENQVAMHQRAHLSTLEAVRNINHDPVELRTLIQRAQEAYDADTRARSGVEHLIAAVALASTRQVDVLGAVVPGLQPLLARIGVIPEKPLAQVAGPDGVDGEPA